VDDKGLSTNLTETERGEETSLDTVGLDRLGRVEEVFESTKFLRDVVGVTIERGKNELVSISAREKGKSLTGYRE